MQLNDSEFTPRGFIDCDVRVLFFFRIFPQIYATCASLFCTFFLSIHSTHIQSIMPSSCDTTLSDPMMTNNSVISQKEDDECDIRGTADLILSKGYKRVHPLHCIASHKISNIVYTKQIALQFPDSLLPQASQIASQLKTLTQASVFVLADTTFGSCCIDEIAAEHCQADLIVHYGQACLSPTTGRVPVHFVFDRVPVQSIDGIVQVVEREVEQKGRVIVVWDVGYDYIIPRVKECCVKSQDGRLVWSSLSVNHQSRTMTKGQYYIGSQARVVTLSQDFALSDYHILYIGPQESLCLTHLLLSSGSIPFSVFDPSIASGEMQVLSSPSVSKLLSRRYFLVQKARDAERIGIVVGTLGVGMSFFFSSIHPSSTQVHCTTKTHTKTKSNI